MIFSCFFFFDIFDFSTLVSDFLNFCIVPGAPHRVLCQFCLETEVLKNWLLFRAGRGGKAEATSQKRDKSVFYTPTKQWLTGKHQSLQPPFCFPCKIIEDAFSPFQSANEGLFMP